MGFFFCWFFVFLLFMVIYNFIGFNYLEWVVVNYVEELLMMVFLGLFLVIGYLIYLCVILCLIGVGGMFLILIVFSVLMWVFYDWGLFVLIGEVVYMWFGIFVLLIVLGIGFSWSIVCWNFFG